MKKQYFAFLTSLLILLILPFPVSAQNVHDINIMNFKLSSDPQGLITSESAQKLNHLNWYLGGMLSYAYEPLSVSLNGDKFAIVCTGSDKCPNEAETIYFAYKKSVILKKSLPVLDVVINVMKTHKQIKYVEVQGHASTTGDADDNATLADARAAAVKKYMLSKGIAADRLGSQGYGETMPLANCSLLKDKAFKECNALNRRVEFSIKASCGTCK